MSFTDIGRRIFLQPSTCAAFCGDVLGGCPRQLAMLACGDTNPGEPDMPFSAFVDNDKRLYVFFLYDPTGIDEQRVRQTQKTLTDLMQQRLGGVSGMDMVSIRPQDTTLLRTYDEGKTIIRVNLSPSNSPALQELMDICNDTHDGTPQTLLGSVSLAAIQQYQ